MKLLVLLILLLADSCLFANSIRIQHQNFLAPIVKRLDDEYTKKWNLKNNQLVKDRLALNNSTSINTKGNKSDKDKNLIDHLLSFVESIFNKNNNHNNQRKKILILMSDTGGGHRASAQALDQAIQRQFPNKIDVDIIDIWTDHSCHPYNKVVPVYQYLAKRPFLWRIMFFYGNFPLTRKYQELDSKRKCLKSFKQVIESSNPDLVISVHPLCHYLPIPIVDAMSQRRLAKQQPRIPFVTVVTDLGSAHGTWFDKRVDACYVPSTTVQSLAAARGIDPQRTILRGLPIRPAFWRESRAPKAAVRAKLGLQPNSRTVLLMGGGDGVGGLQQIAEAVGKQLSSDCTGNDVDSRNKKKSAGAGRSSQLVVICGKNKQAADALSQSLGALSASTRGFNAVVKGFVQNVDEFMAASDCLVTKAGPGTIAEAMTRGLPLVLSSYLPGQEYGNIPYVVDGGFGVYTGNAPRKIAATISSWFQDPEERALKQMSARAKAQARPEATMLIARDIGEVLLHRHRLDQLQQPSK